MTQDLPNQNTNDEIDLRDVVRKLQANIRLILASTLLVGVGAYAYFKTQTKIYSAPARIISSNNVNPTGTGMTGTGFVSSNPLPREALDAAVIGPEVLNDVRANLGQIAGINAAEVDRLNKLIDRVIGSQRAGLLCRLSGRLDLYGNGVYTITCENPDPGYAAGLANLMSDALLRWDTNRIRRTVGDVVTSLEQQIKDISSRLAQNKPGSPESQALAVQLAQRKEDLDNARLLNYSTRGTLQPLTRAAAPLSPVRPNPTLYAALAALVALFGSSLFVFLRSSVQKPVESGDDLKALKLYVIGKLPKISAVGAGVLSALTQGPTAEAMRFVQASLNTLLAGRAPKIILTTSCSPGEGKSSISAGLAYAFASSGQNVLLIDADIHRPAQMKTWGNAADRANWIQVESGRVVNTPEGRGFHTAIHEPELAQAIQLGRNLHLIPSFSSTTKAERFNATRELEMALARWSARYDVIIIDAPPALATVDAMLMAPLVSGVLLVVEARKAGQTELNQVMESLSLTGARVLGAVLNKIDVLNKSDYYGGYGYYGYSKPTRNSKQKPSRQEPVRR